MEEGDRWFHLTQDRKREKRRIADRARKRALRATRREGRLDRAFYATAPKAQMEVTEWVYDEFGNMSRKIFAK